MLKKINCLIIGFFALLTIDYQLGYFLFLPLLFFYILRDSKNIYYFLGAGLGSCLIFTPDNLISYGILCALTFMFLLFIPKLRHNFIVYLLLLLINIGMYLIINQTNIDFIRLGISCGICLLLYYYFEQNLIKALLTNSIIFRNVYLEIIIGLVGILGAATQSFYGLNLSFVLAIYLAMYFSSTTKDYFSMLFSLIVMSYLLFYLKINAGIFIPLISAIYFLPFVMPMVVLNGFSAIAILAITEYQQQYFLAMMAISIIFEVFRHFLIKEKITNEIIKANIYERVTKNVNNEMLSFTRFLDYLAGSMQVSKEENNLVNQTCQLIINKQCGNCSKRSECFQKNKTKLYFYFKELISTSQSYSINLTEFLKTCEREREMQNMLKNISLKSNAPSGNGLNNSLIAQLTGVSNALKRYAIDMLAKEELAYEIICAFKARLIDYGYQIVCFDPIRTFKTDFALLLGIKGPTLIDAQATIKLMAESLFEQKVSVLVEKSEQSIHYLKVVPELKIDIVYGYGAVSSEGQEINGDNYLVQELPNGHFISVISDGMGKGYQAFIESDKILKLIQEIVNLNLDTKTALEILNIFYVLQEYFEHYATLDFLEINRYASEAAFYKMGGTTSYILKTDGSMQRIDNQSLPIGIDDEVGYARTSLSPGDLILMSSDGVFENIVESDKMEGFLQTIKELSPQKIVYELFNYTVASNLKTPDDMTIIALKIKKA